MLEAWQQVCSNDAILSNSHRKKLVRKLSAAARARKARLKTPRKKRVVALPVPPIPASFLQSLLRAASFAARKHQGQTRADNLTPYFSHVARVTLILSHVFGVDDEEILISALLHDTLEDTATDYDEIAALFGMRVADYVVLLTKNVMLPKKEREEDYVRRLSAAPEPVMIAKMADLYDNLSDRVHSPKLAKTASTAERLLQIFGTRVESPLGLDAHAKLAQLLNEVKSLQLPETVPSAPEVDE